jgi:hypothetical protein
MTAHKLYRNRKEVMLTAKEFRLLAYFGARRGASTGAWRPCARRSSRRAVG